MKNKFNLKFSILVIIMITLFSCSKETIKDQGTEPNKQLIQMNNGILAFNNQDEFASYLVQINQMTNQELIDFQADNGYQSFGLHCDELYSQIAQDSLNPDEIIGNINNYNDYLELIPDAEGSDLTLEAKFDGYPLYYIMNLEHMYIVGNRAYKVFDEGIIGADISHKDELENITGYEMIDFEGDAALFDKTPLGWSNASNLTSPHDAGVYKMEPSTNGRDRTKSYIKLSRMASGPAPQFVSTNFVRPYKRTAGIWYWCKRHITYKFRTAVDIHLNNGTYRRDQHPHPTNTEYKYVINIPDVFLTPDLNDVHVIHYAGYDCFGDTPSTDPAAYLKYTYNLQ